MNWRVIAILSCLCFGAGGLAQYFVPSLDFLTAEPAASVAPAMVVSDAAITAESAPAAVGLAPPQEAAPIAAPISAPAPAAAESRAVAVMTAMAPPVQPAVAMPVAPQAMEPPMHPRPAAYQRPDVNPQNRERLNREFVRNCTDNTLAALHRNSVSVPRPRVDVLCRCFAHHRIEAMQASLERSVALDAMTNAVGVINARGSAPRVGYLYLTEFATAERHCPWMRGASMAPEQSSRDPAPPAQLPRIQPVRVSAPQRQ